MKKIFVASTLLCLLTFALVSCAIGGNSDTGNTDNTVGMDSRNFIPGSITINKGENITLENQEATVHIISNGSWQGDIPDSQKEPGAPVVNNVTMSSANQTLVIGPFNTAGTFHYYCMVHDGMSLTVIVH
ncbi:MAG TPA: plastocyanin/azurin family copper-binding protein [Ktedonobacteraceae bacterium]